MQRREIIFPEMLFFFFMRTSVEKNDDKTVREYDNIYPYMRRCWNTYHYVRQRHRDIIYPCVRIWLEAR